MTGLYLVETTAGAIAHYQRSAEGAGLRFRVRSVLPGPTSSLDDEDEDDGRVAPLLLRLRRAADALAVSESTVKRLVRAGDLPSVKVGDARCVRVADLQAFVERLPSGETE